MAVSQAAKAAKPATKKAPANPALTLAARLSQKYGVTESQIISWLAEYGPGLTQKIVTRHAKQKDEPRGPMGEEARKAAKNALTEAKKALVSAVVADHFAGSN